MYYVQMPQEVRVNKISGYVTVFNCELAEMPYLESIVSMLGFCDEVVVLDGMSTDGTWENLKETFQGNSKIVLERSKYDVSIPLMDGMQKQIARNMCSGQVLYQQDADEVVAEYDYERMRSIGHQFKPGWPVISLPVFNLLGSQGHADNKATPWKWRFSWNDGTIGHGVYAGSRAYTHNGTPYSKNTDGCELIVLSTGDWAPNGGFVGYFSPADIAMSMKNAHEKLPAVWHYSWYSMARKARLWHRFWRHQWTNIRGGGQALENYEFPNLVDKEVVTPEDIDVAAVEALENRKDRMYKVFANTPKDMLRWEHRHGSVPSRM